ncbi:hypothetical protein DRO97_04585 [Archaeoglobales archaeon]|nr:MAG: hypothetical protein DRO97_04585 [Archaeoglobales archaeon]
MKYIKYVFLVILCTCISIGCIQDKTATTPTPTLTPTTSPLSKIYYFYKLGCPACENVKPYVENSTKKLNIVFCNVKEMNAECLDVSKSIELYAVPTMAVKQDGDYKVYVGSNKIMEFLSSYDG